jgi:uncharacterized protein
VSNRIRLAAWASLIAIIAALNYYDRFRGSSSSNGDEVYSWAAFAGGLIVYTVWLGLVLGIATERVDLLALRRPRVSWGRALTLALGAFVAIVVTGVLVSLIPLPESPGHEQGLAPPGWEPRHAAAFAANFVLFAGIAPFVEEVTFRGLGQSLLRFLGRWPAIVLVGAAFGVTHGLVEGLLVLVPFGIFLAVLRDRTDSVYPGMVVHAVWNGSVLILSVVT